MTVDLDAEVPTEMLVSAVQDAATALGRKGYLMSALVCLASPRTVRDQKLIERLGHLVEVREAAIAPGDLLVCPLDEADDYLRSPIPESN